MYRSILAASRCRICTAPYSLGVGHALRWLHSSAFAMALSDGAFLASYCSGFPKSTTSAATHTPGCAVMDWIRIDAWEVAGKYAWRRGRAGPLQQALHNHVPNSQSSKLQLLSRQLHAHGDGSSTILMHSPMSNSQRKTVQAKTACRSHQKDYAQVAYCESCRTHPGHVRKGTLSRAAASSVTMITGAALI
jgi:hypothetical protein